MAAGRLDETDAFTTTFEQGTELAPNKGWIKEKPNAIMINPSRIKTWTKQGWVKFGLGQVEKAADPSLLDKVSQVVENIGQLSLGWINGEKRFESAVDLAATFELTILHEVRRQHVQICRGEDGDEPANRLTRGFHLIAHPHPSRRVQQRCSPRPQLHVEKHRQGP
jgi:hypothetical protein